MSRSMSPKLFDWNEGGKDVRRRVPYIFARSDGTNTCEGCGKVVKEGKFLYRECIDIVNGKGANEWGDFLLCPGCFYKVSEFRLEMARRKRRKSQWVVAPPEDVSKLDLADLNDKWDLLFSGLFTAKEVMGGERGLEDPSFSSDDYVHRVVQARDRVKGAMAELDMFLLWRLAEVARETKKGDAKAQPSSE